MLKNQLGELAAFAVVAEERSFTRAAIRLGSTRSALSHSMRTLEKRLGLQLLARTTRSVSPTEAGRALLGDLAPALERIQASLAEVQKRRDKPTGRLRVIAGRDAASMVLMPRLTQFSKAYPEIVLEVTTSNDPVDLVARSFDAGIQIGELIQKDMVAVRVSKDLRLALVGSPGYFKRYKPPKTPHDLKDHQCVAFRFSNAVYRWEFEKGRTALTVFPQGPASFDDSDLVVEAVVNGAGLGMALEPTVAPLVKKGQLIEVLTDWCPVFPGFFLYYPSRRNQPRALTALIETLRFSSAT